MNIGPAKWIEEVAQLRAQRDALLAACQTNLATLGETIRRFERMGFSHHELDAALKETDAALKLAEAK